MSFQILCEFENSVLKIVLIFTHVIRKMAIKIALITSEKLKKEAKKYIKLEKANIDVEILGINVEIAAFMKSIDVVNMISNRIKTGKNFDFIILPGNFVGNTKVIEEKIKEIKEIKSSGFPVLIKGTKNLGDIGILLENIGGLSDKEIEQLHFKSADKILEELIREKLNNELKFIDNDGKAKFEICGRNTSVTVNGIPMVVAEICDAPMLSNEELKERAKYFVDAGAKIIDIGMMPEANPEEVKRIIKAIREVTDVPFSIDTINQDEILEGVKHGVGMIMSIDATNFKIVENFDVPVVVIPRDSKGIRDSGKRIKFLENLIDEIKKKNEQINIIADLILDPPNFGLSNSIAAYTQFRRKHKDMAMLAGVGNVTELMDADSHGINALLTSIAYELKIDLLFTPEYSIKAKNSVREVNTAINMMYLANKRNQPPKDVGIDLLILKDKHKINFELNKINCGKNFFDAENFKFKTRPDKINFWIIVKDKIYVVMREDRNPDEMPKFCLKGSKGEEIYLAILDYVSKHDIKISKEHCAYLGKELSKAEIALKLGKNYVQDDDLFKSL
ncbi:MAG: dihydropteroate synthase-like protein [Candidatus Altarchaeum sp. CG_4_8_14_3_um_filter_33_2054]|nr:MAG: dihydropteroate synthase-like protein [Candidatus Altarchaeum sp. CG_4_8_14_3_um_filter_33_2054]